jgi:hypothetical protein
MNPDVEKLVPLNSVPMVKDGGCARTTASIGSNAAQIKNTVRARGPGREMVVETVIIGLPSKRKK